LFCDVFSLFFESFLIPFICSALPPPPVSHTSFQVPTPTVLFKILVRTTQTPLACPQECRSVEFPTGKIWTPATRSDLSFPFVITHFFNPKTFSDPALLFLTYDRVCCVLWIRWPSAWPCFSFSCYCLPLVRLLCCITFLAGPPRDRK